MSELIEKEVIKQAVKPPSQWNVIFLNDEYTTFEFVVQCLMAVFNKTPEQAFQITQAVHEQGKAIVGQYTKDIAITKQTMAMDFAQQLEHPLKVIAEPA